MKINFANVKISCMNKFSFNSIIRKQQPKSVFIEAIWKSWHRHLSISIVNGIGITKNLFLPSEFFLKKIQYLCFFLCLVMVLVALLQIIFSTISYSSIKGVHWCSRKRLFEHSEASVHCCFKKTTASKISPYFA